MDNPAMVHGDPRISTVFHGSFGVNLGHFGVTLVSIWGDFGVSFGSLRDQFVVNFGSLPDQIWIIFALIREQFLDPSGNPRAISQMIPTGCGYSYSQFGIL